MKNLEIEKLKVSVANFINEINTMKTNVNILIDEISVENEIEIVKNRIEILRKLTLVLNLNSTIKDFLEIISLIEEIKKMIFDFNYVIEIDNPNIIIPTVESVMTSIKNSTISAQGSEISDPELRLQEVLYTLLDSSNNSIEKISALSALEKVTFSPVESGTYSVNGNFSYINFDSSINTFDVLSNSIEIDTIIYPQIEKIMTSINNHAITAIASIKSDPQNRLRNVKYSLFKWDNTLVEEKTVVSPSASVTFDPVTISGDYIVLGEFAFDGENTLEIISEHSEIITINIESDEKIATVKFGANSRWNSGFSGTLEVTSHTDEDLNNNWELVFDTPLTSFNQWQLKSEKTGNQMKLNSNLDWANKPYFTLPPKGSFSLSDISANGAPFNENLISNCRLNGNLVNLYIDGELIDNNKEVSSNGIEDFKTVGYYNDYSTEIPWNKLTYLIYSFTVPNIHKKDGSLFPIENHKRLQNIITKAKSNGVKILIALGGQEYQGCALGTIFSEICATKKGREKLVSNTMALVNQYQLDGVDINWYHPLRGSDDDNFTEVVLEFNRHLKPKNKILTLAVKSSVLSNESNMWIPNWHSNAITNKAIEYVDWLNIMTYNSNSKESHPSISFRNASLDYWLKTRNIKKTKLVLDHLLYL